VIRGEVSLVKAIVKATHESETGISHRASGSADREGIAVSGSEA
jgi:hypothetical protein